MSLGLLFGLLSGQALGALGAAITLASGSPTDIYPGETTTLQIELTNSNTVADVTGVTLGNSLPGTLPNGLEVAGVPSLSCYDPDTNTTDTSPPGDTSGTTGQAISLTGAVIPKRANNTDGSCTLEIPVTAGTSDGSATSYTYTVASGDVTGTDDSGAVSNSGSVGQSINVRSLAQPTISKAFSNSAPILGGAASTLTITISNPGAVDLTGVSIADTFPAPSSGPQVGVPIIEVAPTPNASSSCSAGGTSLTFSPSATDTTLSANGGIVAAGGSCTLSVDVIASHTNGGYETSALTNRIDASTPSFRNDIGIAATADATANVLARSPLAVTKTVSPSAMADGSSGSFTLTFSNSGNSDLTIASFTDDPIDGIGAAGYGLTVTATSTTCAGGVPAAVDPGPVGRNTGVTLTGGTIPAGGSCTLTVNFTGTVQDANTPISYTNSVAEGAVDVGVPAIVSQARSAAITVYGNLDVSKTHAPGNPAPGNPVRYQVTVDNWSASARSNVAINEALANGQTFLTGTINGNDFTPSLSGTGCSGLSVPELTGDTNPVLTIGTVPARAGPTSPGSCVVTFWTMTDTAAADGAVFANQLAAGSVTDGTVFNGTASNSTGGSVDADVLQVVKSFSPAGPLAEGSVTRMRIGLSNLSANDLTSLAISDTLPVAGSAQMQVASPASAATTCGGTITGVPGSTSVSLNGATLPARADTGTGAAGTCFLEVDVTAAAGIYNNTATVTATETYADGNTHTVNANDSESITFTSSLSAAKTFSPAAVSSGGRSTVTIRLSNAGTAALTGVALTDHFTNDGTSGGAPNGMLVADPANASTTCAGTTSIGASPGAGSVTLSGADIVGGGSCDLLFDVNASGASDWVNTIPAGNITADGGVFNQTAVSGTLNYQAPDGLTVAKVTSPPNLTFPGQVSRLTVTINNGGQAVTGLALTDHFTGDGTAGGVPNGMVIAASPSASTTCPGGILSATPSGASVGISGVSLAASQSCTFSVNVSATAVGGVTNTIPAGAITSDQALTNASPANTSLATQANVGLTKQFIPNPVEPGERARLRITVFNPIDQPAASIAFSDTLPPGMTIPAGPDPLTTCSGGVVSIPAADQVSLSGGNLAGATVGAAATCYVEVDVVAAAVGDYTNTIPKDTLSAVILGGPATNSEAASGTLRVRNPLTVHKAFDNNTLDSGNPGGFTTGETFIAPGATATLTIRLENINALPLSGVAFTDNLPGGVAVAPTPNLVNFCGGTVIASPSTTSVRLAGGTVPASGSCSVSVDVLSNTPGSYTNTLAVGSVSSSDGTVNEEPSSARLVIAQLPTLAKQFTPAIISPGGTSKLSLVLGNDNASAITLTSDLTDNLPTAPGAMLVATPPNIGGTCTTSDVTASAGGASVTYASGATIPAGGCTITVDVTAGTAGEHINSILAGALQTDAGNSQAAANASLTVSTLGFITGRVFGDNDATPNGTFESGTDTPLAGATLELRSGADCSGSLVDTATTDALGNYAFTSLAAGTYSVCQPVQPSGTANAAASAGVIVPVNGSSGSAGTASNPTATSSQIAGIVLNTDGAGGETSGSTGNNFSELLYSTLSGSIFRDINNNGLQNGADTGVVTETINLTGNDYLGNPVSLSTTTDADGDYSFTGLLPGTYTLTQPDQPAGTSSGITTAGAVGNGDSAGTASAVTTLPSAISNIVLPPNTVAGGNNFAELDNGRTLSGRMFIDLDNSGTVNGADYGLSGETLSLSGTDVNGNPVTASTTTAADGSYSFTGLPPGTYTVDQGGQPAGTSNGITSSIDGTASNPTATTSRIAVIDLSAGNSVENNFAEQPAPAPNLVISKTHAPANLGEDSDTGYFTLTPQNIGAIPSSGTITLSDTFPAGLTPVSASGTGWSCAVAGQTVSCSSSASLASGASGNPVVIPVAVADGLAGQLLSNTADVAGGGEPAGLSGNNSATDFVPVTGTADVSGRVWIDSNHDRIPDPGETLLADWVAELVLNGRVVASAVTASDGSYSIGNVSPGSGYTLRFRHPETGLIWGRAVANEDAAATVDGVRDTITPNTSGSNAGNPAGASFTGDGTLSGMTLLAGDNITEQSLPLDPAGIVYDSITREPLAGAVITISGPAGFNPATDVVAGTDTVTTGSDGFYQFLLTAGAPNGTYTLEVTTYPAGYVPEPSNIIPECTTGLTVDSSPNPARVQSSPNPPPAGAPLHDPDTCPASSGAFNAANQASTQYYFRFVITLATSADVINNHIPLDPILEGAIALSKTTPLTAVSIGQLVPYTIEARNTLSATLSNIDIRDTLPPGFKYRSGSATLDGTAVEPVLNGRQLTWSNLSFDPGVSRTIKMLLVVGSGVQPGEYVNRVRAYNNRVPSPTPNAVSNEASATVQVIPDPLFDCSDLIGKVFDDDNANGYQDQGEQGIADVRLATARGWLVKTDAEGRFHIACALIPDPERGSNFVMKLDERTLPSGYRLTTENPRAVRLTRGKLAKLNFGAALHRVVRVDMTDAAFVPGGDELLPAWSAQLQNLIQHLGQRPSVLRLAYRVGAEGEQLARERLERLSQGLARDWGDDDKRPRLHIEHEIHLPGPEGARQ